MGDYFTDTSIMENTTAYYEAVRAKGPVWEEPHRGNFIVTGYEQICQVYRDLDTFSSINGIDGPFSGIEEQPHSPEDISELIEQYRDRVPNKENFISYEGDRHTAYRGLMMRMLTPKRLSESEAFMRRAADGQIDTIVDGDGCEFVSEFARPLATLVIISILGVPEEDMSKLVQLMAGNKLPGPLGQPSQPNHHGVLEASFTSYIESRREQPRDDVLTQMARATFPDGTTPTPLDVARAASQLFAGGFSTITRFSTTAVKQLAEQPDLQRKLRTDQSYIPNFVEEMLRLASPAKVNFRMTRKSTTLAGVHIPAGRTMVLLLPAGNRDSQRFERPTKLDVHRKNSREHVAFGRGPHSCPGGPLTRIEGRIVIERLLDRLDDICISAEHHGPASARNYDLIPSYILHGVQALHIKFTAR